MSSLTVKISYVRDLLFNFQNDDDEAVAKFKLQEEGFRFFP